MITIIAGTNRPNSNTEIIAKKYFELISKHATEEVNYYSLQDMPTSILHENMYSPDHQDETLRTQQDEIFIPSDKWFVIIPEYNGSYPGIFKLFIDALSIRNKDATFKKKNLGLVGVASGRAGNLRGMDQLSNSMNYLGFSVFPHKLPISQISKLVDENGELDEGLLELMDSHAKDFVAF